MTKEPAWGLRYGQRVGRKRKKRRSSQGKRRFSPDFFPFAIRNMKISSPVPARQPEGASRPIMGNRRIALSSGYYFIGLARSS